MNNTFRRYIETGKAIAKMNSTSALYEIFKIFLHRLVTGYGAEHYVTYSLFKKPISFKEWREYMDKKYFCKMLFIYNKKSNFRVLEDKVAFAKQCIVNGLPHPHIHFTVDYPHQNTMFPNCCGEELIVAFTGLGNGDYIIKTCYGSYGINLWSITKTETGFFVHNDNSLISAAELARKLQASKECYLVQEKINVAQDLRSIMPGGACGSLRANSFIHADGSIAIPYVRAKLTAIGSVSDNFSGGSSGNMLASINVDTQRIFQVVRKLNDGLLHEITHHPDTGADLRNYHFPNLDAVLALARRCAQVFDQVPAVGWDIVLTDCGAVVLEGNPMFDPIGLQLCANQGVRNIIPKLMGNGLAEL